MGASKYHWINYDEEKIVDSYYTYRAAEKGTEDHEFAALCIRRRERLERKKKTLNMYVNDAIGFRMDPEVLLFYSPNCYATTDAISFHDNCLQIHDLKTGKTPAHMEQLVIYAALFCLEYEIAPGSLNSIELRIYQNNDILIAHPDAMDILPVMDKIVSFDKMITRIQKSEE
jgi:hypothetical protein